MTTTAATAALSVRGISKRYGGLLAVDQVSFDVALGEIAGIIGPNGAGKSTLIGMLSGCLRPTSGEVRLHDVALPRRGAHRSCHLGVVRTYQTPRPFVDLTVRDNLRVAAEHGRAGADGLSIDELLGLCLLADKAGWWPAQLTHADRLRLEFARAMATRPSVLLLDEPGAGLTTSEIAELRNRIRQVRGRGTTVVLVNHVMPLVMTVADRIVVIDFGKKIAEGPPEAVAQDPAVIAAYLGVS